MNKIELKNNINNNDYEIENNTITIKENGNYLIEYSKENNNIKYNFNKNKNIHLLEISSNKNITNNIEYNIYENSIVTISKFYINEESKEEIKINLLETNAKINYNFSCVSQKKDDYNLSINHLCKDTKSHINNRILSLNNSISTINIDSNVKKDIIDCELLQDSKAVIMDTGKVTVKPNMYIDCDDITAKHSASIGKFKDDVIFYLMSRGISKKEAEELLIKSFIYGNFNDKKEVIEYINKYWR